MAGEDYRNIMGSAETVVSKLNIFTETIGMQILGSVWIHFMVPLQGTATLWYSCTVIFVRPHYNRTLNFVPQFRGTAKP